MCVCLVVIGFVMLSIFWAGWAVVPNGIPLGSLLEAFPALHSSFLFLPASFQQEACIYVLSAVGLWDSAWQMANLSDRSKCINYHKIRWF